MPTADAAEVIQQLQEGNRRFVSGTPQAASAPGFGDALAAGQSPVAVVLGCSDSRVPPEMVFDQPPGRLFVVRVAGNIATATQTASIQFAIATFATPLVIVLGHSSCGAVCETLKALAAADDSAATDNPLIAQIRPAVQSLLDRYEGATSPADLPADLVAAAVAANTQATVAQLTAQLATTTVIGCHYDIATGTTTFS